MVSGWIAAAGLGALCAAWVALQRWIARSEPRPGDAEQGCASCAAPCERDPGEAEDP